VSAARVRATRRRLWLAQALLLGAFLGLAARAAHLSVFDERGLRLGERQSRTALTLAPERGAIFDRGGHELALSVGAPSVYVMVGELADPARDVPALARALGTPASALAKRLRGRNAFVWVARWVPSERAERVRALGLRGVGIALEPRRIYPYKALAGSLVGFANIDGQGARGVEQQEDAWLRGIPRRLPVERDGSGQLLVTRGEEHWLTAGGDVALTLDVAMQADAALALEEAVRATGARGGAVVTLDPRTGDLLALAEWPSFDPNRFRDLPYAETRSRAFLDAQEPGSTLKAFLVAAALEEGALDPAERIDCEDGELELPGKTIRDLHPHGALRAEEILRFSSNIGAVKIAQRLGPEAHASMLRRFGFGARSGSGFPDESAGLLRTPGPARPVDQAALAFGQGLSVTPVQLAAATAALANGGTLMRTRLVAARRSPGGAWRTEAPEALRRVVSERTAATLLRMLESATGSEGTGRLAGLRDVRVAGKTGTAQKLDLELGRYSDRRYVAWFIGAVPAEAPRLAIAVALDEPRRGTHTGGAVAAPLFARVAAAQLARLGILTEPEPAPAPPLPETRVAAAAPAPRAAPPAAPRAVPEVARLADRVLLPDLLGLTVAEVQAVSREARLAVQISGRGRAVAQSPPPGTVVAASEARIQVRFEPPVDPI
jgi:cell division protein FtsI (penicillin-binding protein 3)